MAHGAKPLPTSDGRPVRLGDLDLVAHLTDPARKQAFVTPDLRLSDTICAGTPPNQASARPCDPIQSGSVCVHVASAKV